LGANADASGYNASGSEGMGNLGLAWKFGKSNRRDAEEKTTLDNCDSVTMQAQIQQLQDENRKLQDEVRKQKDENQKQQREIQQMKEEIDALKQWIANMAGSNQ